MTDRRIDATSPHLVTCKGCRLAMYRQGPNLPEHGPVDNRCKNSAAAVTDATVEGWAKAQAEMTKRRKKLEALAYRHKHADFKGKREDGVRTVLKLVRGSGTCLVELSSLTDAELVDMLPRKVRDAEGYHAFRALVTEETPGGRKRQSWLMKNSRGDWALGGESLKVDAHLFTEEWEVESAMRAASSEVSPWERVYI